MAEQETEERLVYCPFCGAKGAAAEPEQTPGDWWVECSFCGEAGVVDEEEI